MSRFLVLLLLALSPFWLKQVLTPGAPSHVHVERSVASENDELETNLRQTLSRIEEIQYLLKISKQMGVKRVYFFGGTAATLANYSYWNDLRSHGAPFLENKFDFDFYNIFTSNQDFDFVLDTDTKTADQIKEIMKAQFPYTQNGKSIWEVRLMNEAYDNSMAFANDDDLLVQNTDSMSIGMVDGFTGEVTDVYEFRGKNNFSLFKKDLVNRAIHFLDSSDHYETSRARGRSNPKILSAVRFFSKAFQFNLKINERDGKLAAQYFDQLSDIKVKKYAQKQFEYNSLKMIQNAQDLNEVWKVLNQYGILEKLRDYNEVGIDDHESLGYWFSRKPLDEFSIGSKGGGRTALELGITEVTHSTRTYEAYLNITRNLFGKPNVFISRKGVRSEAASKGDGFYVKHGDNGAWETFNITFFLNPNAREGVDFKIYENEIVVLNRSALKIKELKINLSLKDVLPLQNNGHFQALFPRVKRKIKSISEDDLKYLESIEDKVTRMRWLKSGLSHLTPHLIVKWVHSFSDIVLDRDYLYFVTNHPEVLKHIHLTIDDYKFIKKYRDEVTGGGDYSQFHRDIFNLWKLIPDSSSFPPIKELSLFEILRISEITVYVPLIQEYKEKKKMPTNEEVYAFFKRDSWSDFYLQSVLKNRWMSFDFAYDFPEVYQTLCGGSLQKIKLQEYVVHEFCFNYYLKNYSFDSEYIKDYFAKNIYKVGIWFEWKGHEKHLDISKHILDELIKKQRSIPMSLITESNLLYENTELALKLIKGYNGVLFEFWERPESREYDDFFSQVLRRYQDPYDFVVRHKAIVGIRPKYDLLIYWTYARDIKHQTALIHFENYIDKDLTQLKSLAYMVYEDCGSSKKICRQFENRVLNRDRFRSQPLFEKWDISKKLSLEEFVHSFSEEEKQHFQMQSSLVRSLKYSELLDFIETKTIPSRAKMMAGRCKYSMERFFNTIRHHIP